MSGKSVAINPRGIFDRGAKGKSLTPVSIQVERGRIQFFAHVLGETDPIHTDVSSARAVGFPDVVAPTSFFTVLEAAADEERRRVGQDSTAVLLNCDYRYLLHGDEAYEYGGLVFAGDEVTLTTSIVDFYDKKGGDLEFVTCLSVLEHARRGVLVRATRNLLHRLP